MSINIKTANFEGPFDLLLQLVLSKRVDISSISIAEVTDQYLSIVSRMVILDTETASDFMLVAATLLEIKTRSLLPRDIHVLKEEEQLSPLEARELLIEKLIIYKQFKNAAEALTRDFESEKRHLTRTFGPTSDFKDVAPDFLKTTTVEDMAQNAARLLGRKDQFLLASSHIASKPLNTEVFAQTILARCRVEGKTRFSKLVEESPRRDIVVVTLLAVLELYKRNLVNVEQVEEFGDIEIEAKENPKHDGAAGGSHSLDASKDLEHSENDDTNKEAQ